MGDFGLWKYSTKVCFRFTIRTKGYHLCGRFEAPWHRPREGLDRGREKSNNYCNINFKDEEDSSEGSKKQT